MKLNILCFTAHGWRLGQQLCQNPPDGWQCQCAALGRFANQITGPFERASSLKEWTKMAFETGDGLLFVGATGIAVRAIAPFLKGKDQDPAVVVMDEQGRFAISLLSGHLGGANALTEVIAARFGATAVITTATDRNKLFAVDVFAAKNGLVIDDLKTAKECSAALLRKEKISFFSQWPVNGIMPQELTTEPENVGISIGLWQEKPFETTVSLLPKHVVLGIGCRRNLPPQVLEETVSNVLRQAKISEKTVCALASIDLKQKEPALLQFCEMRKIPFITYSSQELQGICRPSGLPFTPSAFVAKTTGVDNVCERAAVLHSGGDLILEKQAGNGVTVAAALRPFELNWNKE